MNNVVDTKKSISTVITVSYLVHYVTLLQNATDVITKCDKSLLQNATVITKYVSTTINSVMIPFTELG